MRRTLFLVFIHGFKGGDDTFGTFPEHVKALISHALPKVNVLAVQYPKFETRGDLRECVARLREWLENKVIDLEVANSAPSPTVDPSVHTILVGHSMGGIVAAELLLLLAGERSITSSDIPAPQTETPAKRPSIPVLMFPYVRAVVAFDTPYLGLAPEMVAHGLEGGHKFAASAWETANEWASAFGYGTKAPESSPAAARVTAKSAGALPAPVADAAADAAATPRWQSWGKYAMFAGAAGAMAAGGAAALYSQREKISAGWGWATSHLLFVGDLARAENLRKRVEMMELVITERELGGCVNFYTNLGRGARQGYGITEHFAGRERTFCNLPKAVKDKTVAQDRNIAVDGRDERGKLRWIRAVNEKATDETGAHVSMFFPRDNPGFYNLSEQAVEVISKMVDQSWYESGEGPDIAVDQPQDKPMDDDFGFEHTDTVGSGPTAPLPQQLATSIGKDWEGLDKHEVNPWATDNGADDDDDVEMTEHDKNHRDELEDSVIIDNMRSSNSGLKRSASEAETKAAMGPVPLPD